MTALPFGNRPLPFHDYRPSPVPATLASARGDARVGDATEATDTPTAGGSEAAGPPTSSMGGRGALLPLSLSALGGSGRPDSGSPSGLALTRIGVELRRVNLRGLALFLENAPDKSAALLLVAEAAELVGAATIRKRNRKRHFLERCCLGALGHAQMEIARRARDLASS